MKTPVDDCPAGPAMDAAVARIVGIQVQWRPSGISDKNYPAHLVGTMAFHDDWMEEEDWQRVSFYSVAITAAWSLLSGDATVHKTGDQYHCIIGPEYGLCMELLLSASQAVADTLPLAICRAFLKANGVEFVEVPDENAS